MSYLRAHYDGEITKRILRLALPAAANRILAMLGNFISLIMVAHLGQKELAASALLNATQSTLIVIGFSILFAVGIIAGRLYGEQRYHDIGVLVQQSWIVGVIVSIPIIIIAWNVGPILTLFHQPKSLIIILKSYFHAYIWAVVPVVWLIGMQQFCFAVLKQRLALSVKLIGTTLQIVFSYILIFGKWGFPKLGVNGFAYALAAQTWITIIIMLICFYYMKSFARFGIFKLKPGFGWHFMRKLLKIGWPISIQFGGELLFFFIATIFVGWLGNDALAARQITTQYNILFIIPIFGASQATGVLIGHAYGSKKFFEIRHIGNISMALGALFMCFIAIVYLLAPTLLASFYMNVNDPSNAHTLHLVILLFIVLCFSQFFDAVRNLASGALRGLFDTKFPMVVSLIVLWVIGAPLAYVLGIPLHLGVVGIALGGMTSLFLGMIAVLWRWKEHVRKLQTVKIS